MPLQLQFGGGTVRNVPTLDIRHWRRTSFVRGRAVFRPGGRALLHRFAVTALAAILAGSLYAIASGFTAPGDTAAPDALRGDVEEALHAMRDTMSEEEWQQLVERTEATRREHEARREARQEQNAAVRGWVMTGVSWAVAVLAFFGLLAPLSCAWNRLVLTNPDGHTLEVRYTGAVRTRKARFPLAELGEIRTLAHETWGWVEHGGRHYLGWRWRVLVTRRGTPMPAAEFWVDQDKRLPLEGHMTGPVREFAEALASLTGIRPAAPEVRHGDEPRRQTVSVPGDPVVTRRASLRLDDIPDAVREDARTALRGDTAAPNPASSTRITVRNADGTVRTYDSPDQMPPALRKLYEEAKRRAR